ncbi:Uncharacterised protein [Legionella geestiana]|nr:Uncharacterised protein [Legionella geestiana]
MSTPTEDKTLLHPEQVVKGGTPACSVNTAQGMQQERHQ